jgi:hypothetical protein
VSFTDNGDGTATLAGTPAGGTGGSYALTLTASNGVLPNSSQAFTLSVLEPTTITSANAATFTTASAGSFTVTTAGGYPAPAVLSETGALPAGLSFTDNGDGTATLAGTPAAGTGGTYSVTLTANNGVAPNATQSFTLTVNAPPTITSADHATFSVGTTGSFTVTTTPGTPSATTLTLLAGSLPTGVTFVDNGDGTATLSGTPAAGTGGTHAVTVSASNGVPSDATQSFTLTVTELAGITSAPTATFTTGTAGSFTVTTTAGFPTATTLTETGALPGGLTFTDNGDGTATLAGTPVSGSGGTYSLTLTATNSAGGTSQSFTLTVDEPPTITSVDQATFEVGTAGSFTVTTSAGNPTATVVSLTGTLPSGVAFVDNGDGTATLSGTPATGTGGTYVTSLTASNGIAPDATQSFTLTVEETAGITSSDATTFTVGSAGTFTVTSSAGFPPGTTLTRTGALPAGVTFTDNGDGTATLAGTPAAGEGGSYALTLKATNSVGTTSQAFTLTVQELSSFTSSATHTFTAGVAGTFSVTTTGGFPTPPALTSSGDLPDGVTFVDDGDGTATLAGTPAAGGTYALVLTATTAAGPVTQSFTLTVNGPPSITSDPAVTFTAGVATTYDVVSRAGIPTATSLTVAGALPAGVTFTDDGDGTGRLSGTAGSDAVGSYPLTVTASNGVDPDATQAFTLTVVLAGAVALPDTLPPSDGALLGVPQTAVAGSPITVTGTNFAAGATVTLGLYSTPTALGTAQANGVGTFTKTLTLPSITGTHTVVAAGIGKDGTVQYLSSTIVLTAPAPAKASGGAALAVTGSLVDPVRGATLGLLLMLSGAGLVYGFRRRA